MTHRPTRVLLVYPKFVPNSFWGYTEACELVGARYPAAPLGLITVAAMLPQDLGIPSRQLQYRRPRRPADLDWADMVMTGGMLYQQPDCLRLIEHVPRARQTGRGRRAGCHLEPHLYASADFQVLGEAEDVIEEFVAAWQRGERSGVFDRRKIHNRRHQDADAALRSAQIRPLPLHLRPVLARLPVHLRVLRHHRALRPHAAHQDQRRRFWQSCTGSTSSATAAMSISSTTT